jgi:hypothetical protein
VGQRPKSRGRRRRILPGGRAVAAANRAAQCQRLLRKDPLVELTVGDSRELHS